MTDFDDSADPELGAACNRLAAYTLPIPEGALIDEASGLTERDLVLILRALHRSRHAVMIRTMSMEEMNEEIGKPIAAARAMGDADLLRAYQETDGDPTDFKVQALVDEIRRRELDI